MVSETLFPSFLHQTPLAFILGDTLLVSKQPVFKSWVCDIPPPVFQLCDPEPQFLYLLNELKTCLLKTFFDSSLSEPQFLYLLNGLKTCLLKTFSDSSPLLIFSLWGPQTNLPCIHSLWLLNELPQFMVT